MKQQSGTMSWLRAVYFLDEERGWAVGGTGVLIATTDGGRNWRLLPRPTDDTLRDVFFNDARTGWLVCDKNIYQRATGAEARSYLMRTEDGGSSWRRVEPAGAGERDVRLVRVLFADAARGWAFGEMGALFATQDGGATWTRQSTTTRHLLLGGTFLDPARGWLVGAGATLLHTTDGGATWRAGLVEANAAQSNVSAATSQSVASSGARLNAVSFVDARRGWAVGARGAVYSTSDGGNLWRAQASGTTDDLFDVKFLDAREGWAAGTNGTLLHTSDGGAHWLAESSGTTHPLERIFFAGRARGWAVGFGGTILAYTPAPPAHAPTLRGGAN